MEIFKLTLNQMLVIFILMLIGYLMRQKNVVEYNASANLSKMELFIFSPALNFITQAKNCTVQNLSQNWVLILYGGATILVAVILAEFLSRVFVPDYRENRDAAYKRCIYKYSIAFANYGFFGNFIILSVFGEEMLFKYQMFTLLLSFFVYSWGMYTLIPKDRNSGISKHIIKGLTSPPMLSIVGGMLFGLLNLGDDISKIPFVDTVLTNAGDCMGPVAMLLAGMALGNYDLRDMFRDKKIYIVSALRLIVIPAVFVLVHKLIGTTNPVIIPLTLIAFAGPLGMNTIVFPAAYGGDTKTGASMTLISSLFSVITLPLMYYLFVVLLG